MLQGKLSSTCSRPTAFLSSPLVSSTTICPQRSVANCAWLRASPAPATKTDAKTSNTSSVPLEGVDTNYCDDFVCTSSPAVEQTVRSFARDLERSRFTPALFARDTTYSDGLRRFSGASPYSRRTWVMDCVQKPKATISRLQMLDKATAQVDWRLTGQLSVAPIDISLTSVIEMNLVTGKIVSHKESWDLSRLSPPVRFFVTASRTSWSAKQASLDAQEGLKSVADSISTMGSTDEDSGQIYRDPTDPTRFFQAGQDQQLQDMISFAMIAIAMYAVFKGFSVVVKL